MPNSVIEHEPASRGLDGRWGEANLVGVPPGATPCFQHEPMSAPMMEIRRVGNPHVRLRVGVIGSVNKRPVPTNPTGEKRRIFVVWRHDDAVALETAEVCGQSQRHSGTAARIRSVGDHIFLQVVVSRAKTFLP